MRWLHITDIHTGYHGNDPSPGEHQVVALRELMAQLTDVGSEWTPLDFVFITGDIAWSGTAPQYLKAKEHLVQALRRIPIIQSAKIVICPGNHDINHDEVNPLIPGTLGPKEHLIFEESAQGVKARKPMQPAFQAFEEFCIDVGVLAALPSQEVSRLVDSTNVAGRRIGIVATNTSLFCNKEKAPDALPAPLTSLRHILQSSECDGHLILGHHPVSDFALREQSAFRQLLNDRRCVYLHGHTHQTQTHCSRFGISEIGFGAAYPGRLTDAGKYPYRHTISVGYADDEGYVHIQVRTFDGVKGRWAPEFNPTSDCQEQSPGMPVPTYRFHGPWSEPGRSRQTGEPVAGMNHLGARIQEVICPKAIEADDWKRILIKYSILDDYIAPNYGPANLDVAPDSSIDESRLNVVTSIKGMDHVRCMGSPGGVVSKEQILQANTDLDTEGYSSVTLVTMGSLSEDAHTLLLKLQNQGGKKIKVVDTAVFRGRIMTKASTNFLTRINTECSSSVRLAFVIIGSGHYLLVEEAVRRTWFSLFDEQGVEVPETSTPVKELREYSAFLRDAYYGRLQETVSTPGCGDESKFDVAAYRTAIVEEYNNVKYAALSALGFRFAKTTLEELYVETGAHPESGQGSGAALDRAVDEFLEGYTGAAAFRETLREQLRSGAAARFSGGSQVGHARRLYHQKGSMLILGDPGSGKTLFVKRELLAYGKPEGADSTWYERHIPVYLPLAEIAKMSSDQEGSKDLLWVAARLSKRGDLRIPEMVLREHFERGHLALFFDGLDEVGLVKDRQRVAASIKELIDRGRHLGNRFVITSRPSAAQLVELPDDLPSMTLAGLDRTQIRDLAQRILRASAGEGGVLIDIADRTDGKDSVIEQLMRDCETKPGIARLASNPLLLTLLIMVYMNSGAPTAKRHRIYQQAVQTLVTVRSRGTGQTVPPESDLRHRLGMVALNTLRDPRIQVPSVAQVVKWLQPLLTSHVRGPIVSESDARTYMHEIADATGIVNIILNGPVGHGSVVFMHYSFLEYFAAEGLLREGGEPGKISKLRRYHKWREIVLLYSGLLGDRGNMTPLISAMLEGQTPSDRTTLDTLLFAFDCALEAEVPPDDVQGLLLTEVQRAMRGGARVDAELLGRVGDRLNTLYEASRSPHVHEFLKLGLRDPNGTVASAFLILLSRFNFSEEHVPHDIGGVLDDLFRRGELPILLGACEALARRPTLLRPAAIQLLKEGIERGEKARYAILGVCERIPSLVKLLDGKVELLIRDQSARIAVAAARAVVISGVRGSFADEANRSRLLESLRVACRSSISDLRYRADVEVEQSSVKALLASPDSNDRELGIYLLPWLRREAAFVKAHILEMVREPPSREHLVAAVHALRMAPDMEPLLTSMDVQALRRHLHQLSTNPMSRFRDVRIAVARALGDLGHASWGESSALKEYAKTHARGPEYREALAALTALRDDGSTLRAILIAYLLDMNNRLKWRLQGDHTKDDLLQVLSSVQSVAWDEEPGFVSGLKAKVKDSRLAVDVRGEILKAYAMAVEPSVHVLIWLAKLVKTPPPKLEEDTAHAIHAFLKRCHKRFNLIMSIVPGLEEARDMILERVNHPASTIGGERITDSPVKLRDSVEIIETVLMALREAASPG
ncbi:MAG: metallophosphoesterase [Deltaproteobacteria bacterium]|nr:metallophosphoesterase [Deltaproteobacteria bacterium]